MKEFNIEEYLTKGVERIVNGIFKSSFKNPKASLFITKYVINNKKANDLRKKAENEGRHIPPFLIASITSKCNLHCKGCYARANNLCVDEDFDKMPKQLEDKKWKEIFEQAVDMGVSFIILAGGEPFVRRDVLEMAGKTKEIIFPVFTNGTMINDEYMKFLDNNRNVLPVISLEGNEEKTDDRRGKGVYKYLSNSMLKLQQKGILFGVSVTVHKNNLDEVFDEKFISSLSDKGCKSVIYVEYVPVDHVSRNIAPDENDREKMKKKIGILREKCENMIFIAFPGDEKTSGGCVLFEKEEKVKECIKNGD